MCNQPISRGFVRLTSNRIKDQPAINPNFLKNQEDIKCMIRAIRLSMKLIATEPFQKMNSKIHWPKFDECKNFRTFNDEDLNVSDRYLECIIRLAGVTAHHPGIKINIEIEN